MFLRRELHITWGIAIVVLKVSPVLGLESPSLRSGDSMAQNRLDFQHNNYNHPRNVNLPPQNHYARGHKNIT